MSPFRAKIEALIEQIQSVVDVDERISIPFEPDNPFSPLDWLEAQPHSTKLYWQSRDKNREVIALGVARTFDTPELGAKYIKSNQNLWVVMPFDAQHPDVFLPNIELQRLGSNWTLSVNVNQSKEVAVNALERLKLKSPTHFSSPNNAQVEFVRHIPDLKDWTHSINLALSTFEQSDLKKVVLARESEFLLSEPVSGFTLLRESQISNQNSYHFAFTKNRDSLFFGSSPECLFRQNGYELETEALAGTIERGCDTRDDHGKGRWLRNDKKNRYENQLVVEDIESRLHPYCSSLEISEASSLIRLAKVQHLKRKIVGYLNPQKAESTLVDVLHPTAAIAGLPKDEAVEFIQQNEPFERGLYSGAIGYISQDRSEFCVSIRSALINKKSIKFYAGAGIVPGSDPNAEWQELNKKMSTLLDLLTELPEVEVAS
ncbi:isochorismate synthase [Vibrio nigripulchritudo]|uniref:isochorismate synthase n=1 Tax=Vibrio nigripulchritudo TaxID=28173 RepID=UPI0005F9F4E7|nr:isochorismate synthase [Vibrio nigripulchritudo]KJY81242.1 hypothetical protein TW74_02865 [Vibrio nigripulchritudo]